MLRTRSILLSFLPLLLCLFSLSSFAEEEDFRSFVVGSRPAEEVLPMIQQIFGNRIGATVYQNKIVARGSTEVLKQLEKFLKELDQPLRQLRIESMVATRGELDQQDADVEAVFGSSQAKVKVNAHDKNNPGVALRFSDDETRRLNRTKLEIRAMENSPVSLFTGGKNLFLPRVGVSKDSLLAVKVRLMAESKIQLSVDARNSVAEKDFSSHTELQAQLGEWVEVAAMDSQDAQQTKGILAQKSADSNERKKLWVRVSLVKDRR